MSPRAYEEEPSVGQYRRSVHGYDSASSDDRELTLGTPTILGLFFALVLVCGCFFGLGYAMGHRSVPATPQVFDSATAPATGVAKPTPGSAAQSNASSAPDASAPSPADVAAPSGAQTATVSLNPSAAPTAPSSSPAAPVAGTAIRPISAASSPAPQPATTTPASPGNFVVQVAAVSSQDVANILLSTLQKKGYAVAVRHEPQDQLLHVQIGPFPDRKDAEAMRQRVLADGFNAIVK